MVRAHAFRLLTVAALPVSSGILGTFLQVKGVGTGVIFGVILFILLASRLAIRIVGLKRPQKTLIESSVVGPPGSPISPVAASAVQQVVVVHAQSVVIQTASEEEVRPEKTESEPVRTHGAGGY